MVGFIGWKEDLQTAVFSIDSWEANLYWLAQNWSWFVLVEFCWFLVVNEICVNKRTFSSCFNIYWESYWKAEDKS
jgi:hypothetical protein